MQKATKQPLFDTGQLVATPGALEKPGQSAIEFLSRHVCGNWGELPDEDKAENHFTLEKGFRLLSSFRTAAGDKLWSSPRPTVPLHRSRDKTICLLHGLSRLVNKTHLDRIPLCAKILRFFGQKDRRRVLVNSRSSCGSGFRR
jgi:hypothetical protein